MQSEIPKVYSPEAIEPRWARYWVDQKLYRPSDDGARPRFSLSLPPPNITGSLHMGHMLEHTEIDILMRWHRMRGENVLWLPGMDHASISTQMIVEREIGREALPDLEGPQARHAWQREGQRRRLEMGPEKFLERCWQWKEQNGDTIRRQMERMGASVDWTRARFTMDAAYSRAVIEVFVRLYEEGLIYRGHYIVNWCPRCGTAVSDLEVEHQDRAGHLWYIRYPFEDGSGHIVVATTRPETMLGDTAVAVNPNDTRYHRLIGRKVILPLLDRSIPVIGDSFVDPTFGTGAVKVTPAHDPNDFAIGQRHNLPGITVIDFDAHMTDDAGPYARLSREQARVAVVRDLEAAGLIEKIEDYKLSVAVCERCKTIVEPLLSKQWFVRMKPLAEPAIRAVEEGRIRIIPDNSRKVYLDWMYRIYDWCISRQLWWGHRIPAWYCDACGEVIVAREAPSSCPKCQSGTPRQDPDVLDTWFSSGLWPFATLGWPGQTDDLRRFYPNDLMIMGFDILFFWAARMIVLGLKFTEDVPFRELYVHALVRDAERQKMSKTKGNVLDPLEITEKYGTDAVRFALASSAAPGTDIAFSEDRVKGYRDFANKIWNAGRFILMNLGKLPAPALRHLGTTLDPIPAIGFDAVPHSEPESEALRLADCWIFSRLATVTREMNEDLAAYRFHEAAHTIYHFFWHELCDWYLEWVKPEVIKDSEGPRASAACINLARVFETALHLLHPFMPFLTEELWHQLPRSSEAQSISVTSFDLANPRAIDSVSEKQFQTVQELIVAARNVKAEMGLQKEKPSAQVASDDLRILELFRSHQEPILNLAGLEALNFVRGRLPAGAAAVPLASGCDLRLFYERAVDPASERLRLERDLAKVKNHLEQTDRQLKKESFRNRAPQEVVAGVERRRAELADQYARLAESLARLDGFPAEPKDSAGQVGPQP
ncbi:MAG TPA: valine--tRNA ligase [Terriglobia bacterium]|nr:valine--tRNA ligase [Terriglobia bacterium]